MADVTDTYAELFGAPRVELGPMASDSLRRDPKHLLFTLSRYKFVAQLLAGKRRVLEVGCGDGLGARLVAQTTGYVLATDADPRFIAAAGFAEGQPENLLFRVYDPSASVMRDAAPRYFDAAYALDVLEHVKPQDEALFLESLVASLTTDRSVLVIGTPSLESQRYASELSRAAHVNCKSGPDLVAALKPYFPHVFAFSMNDEVVHTGFYGMAHYLFAVGIR